MTKILTLLLFSTMLFNIQTAQAAQQNIQSKQSSGYEFDANKDYDFNTNSYNISDEQIQDVKDSDILDQKMGFDAKVINSGYFTSNTATKTWVPLNRER